MLHSLNRAFRRRRGKGAFQSHRTYNKYFHPLLSGRDSIAMAPNQKEKVDELKIEWKRLWIERLDDKVRAEGIATHDYSSLFVDKGTVIHATRDYKALNFKEILQQHQILDVEKFIPPSPEVGGWKKFVKTKITSQNSPKKKRVDLYFEEKKEKQQPKKGGRGWLHK